MQTNPHLLSTVEVAEILGVSRFQVLRLVKRGELSPRLQGPGKAGAKFFRPSDIERLRKARERAA